MTVRFDRFPNFNGYVLQQLNPSLRSGSVGSKNKPGFLTNLAFERNLFQHKYYYGSAPQFQPMAQPYLSGPFYPSSRNFGYRALRPAHAGDVTEEGEDENGRSDDENGYDKSAHRKPRMSMADLGPPLAEIERTSDPTRSGPGEY